MFFYIIQDRYLSVLYTIIKKHVYMLTMYGVLLGPSRFFSVSTRENTNQRNTYVDNYRVFVIVFSRLRLSTFVFSCFRVLKLLSKNAMALTWHRNYVCFSKFICINDDIDYSVRHEAEAAVKLLHDFYEKMFPEPSSFEVRSW